MGVLGRFMVVAVMRTVCAVKPADSGRCVDGLDLLATLIHAVNQCLFEG